MLCCSTICPPFITSIVYGTLQPSASHQPRLSATQHTLPVLSKHIASVSQKAGRPRRQVS